MNDVLTSAIHFALDLGLKATAIFLVTGAALLLLHRASFVYDALYAWCTRQLETSTP